MQKYKSDIQYNSRESKASYIFDKYSSLFKTTVLDIGADAMYLKPSIAKVGGNYKGIGYGENIDVQFNLESTPYPFKDNEYDTVICLDVLEHLENIHKVFDDICRIADKNIIISLPNPWSDFFTVLMYGDHSPEEKLKFYGLPTTKPSDRHRWFFSSLEAKEFINQKAKENGWKVVQVDTTQRSKKMGGNGLKGVLGRFVLKTIFRSDIDSLELHHPNTWFVLEKIK